MKKILFTHSYFLRFDAKQWKTGKPYAPIGTLYAAALLRQHGFDVAFHDTMFTSSVDDICPALHQHRPAYFVIYDDGFNYLTKMCLSNMREAAFGLIRHAKQCGCTVLVSSSDSTDHYGLYLEAGADVVLLGEAEHSLLELVRTLEQGHTDFSGLGGIAWLQNNRVVKTARRPVIKDLDSLPLPAWDLIDIYPYKTSWLKHAGYFSINVATTRGCPFKCNWCAKPIYGNRYNSRSPEHVIEELKLLRDLFQYDHIWFCDDIFGLKPGWVQDFAALAKRAALQLSYKIQSRADLLLQENYVSALAASGCESVWMGAESGSQKVLDAMDKGIRVEQIYQATRLLKHYGIRPCFFIQFGYPGELKADIELTVNMINELLPHEIGISVSYPLPGTAFYEKVKSDMQQKFNWTDSDEMALLFQNTFKPAFYKQLHRYVHKSYRRQIALNNLRYLTKHPFKADAARVRKVLSSLYYVPAALVERFKLNLLEKA